MKIDDAVEDTLREIIASTVAGQRDRFDAAVGSVADQGDEFTAAAVNLAFSVSRIALYLVHGQQWPGEARIDELATSFEVNEDWAGIDRVVAKDILGKLVEEHPSLDAVDLGPYSFALFAITGWLVAGFDRPEGVTWSDLLDEIEHEIEQGTV